MTGPRTPRKLLRSVPVLRLHAAIGIPANKHDPRKEVLAQMSGLLFGDHRRGHDDNLRRVVIRWLPERRPSPVPGEVQGRKRSPPSSGIRPIGRGTKLTTPIGRDSRPRIRPIGRAGRLVRWRAAAGRLARGRAYPAPNILKVGGVPARMRNRVPDPLNLVACPPGEDEHFPSAALARHPAPGRRLAA